jgi:hypothetical protein
MATAAPVILYNGSGNENPLMETPSTWPEPPEYYANWGVFDGMEPPYIRLSGQSGESRDWAVALTFANLPAAVSGGSLQMHIRAASSASVSVWLETSTGNGPAKTYSLTANQTSSLDISLSDLGIALPAVVSKMHLRLNQVPANQHTTVFLDNIMFSGTANPGSSNADNSSSSFSSGTSSSGTVSSPSISKPYNEYLISADTVVLSDYAKTLGGGIYGNVLELGADTKVYGNASAGTKCFLRERAGISDTLIRSVPCARQNGISIGREIRKRTDYSHTWMGSVSAGSLDKSVAIDADELLLPGAYGNLRVDARSTVRLQSGSYAFQSIHTEPDAKWVFDLSNGPVKIYVQSGMRLADRNVFSISGGNPSEIEWHVSSGDLDMGTDGKFFGRFIAPSSSIRLATRSHIVGGVEARHFRMEPQSTVSMEPRAEEISHSEYNFGPFWDRNAFRYRSALPQSVSSLEMHVYAQGFGIAVDGSESRNVSLEKTSQKVSVKLSRPFMADFPPEAFSSTYEFAFGKTSNYRVYWNPASPCVSNCHGTSEETALRSFSQALAEAQRDGLEVRMTGGEWEVPEEHGVFPVGLELVGTEKPFWELSSFSEIPTLNVKNTPIELAGKSPRRLTGLHMTGGTDGALKASTEKLELISMAFTRNESKGNGGAVYYGGKGLFAGKTLLLESGKGNRGGGAFVDGNAEIEDLVCSGNSSMQEGGCLYVLGSLRLANAVFHGNRSRKEGGAFQARSASVLNATAVGNESGGSVFAGGSGSVANSVFRQNSGGDIPGSWTAQYSAFPSGRNGTGNVSGDPKFMDEKNPAGDAHFFGYDAGLILADKSPALKGSKVEGTPELDLLGTERGKDVAMGAYGDYSDDGNAFQYVTWDFGNLKKAVPGRPLFSSFSDQNLEDYIGYGRIITRLVKKHSKTKISKAIVRITLMDSTANAYPDSKPIDVPFYWYREEDGKYLFSTFIHAINQDYDAGKHGRMVLFSKDPSDQGVYDNVIVIHAKEITDRFKYKVLK